MLNKIFFKFYRSVIKIILPIIFKIFISLRVNRRVINYLQEKSYFSNSNHNFSPIIESLLNSKKLFALDVGAQGGFNSDGFFSKKYIKFFNNILVEPNTDEANKLIDNNLINKGLWSKKEVKQLNILDNRVGSSSIFEPNEKNFDLHDIPLKDFSKFKVTRTVDIHCDTIEKILNEKNIDNLDYLKIDTQGSELEILKGLGKYKPLLIKIEVHFFSMYKKVPSWNELVNYLYKLDYILIDLKGIGKHITRIPAEADMIFIPNFETEAGKKIIHDSYKNFISLMLIFGQIKLLKSLVLRLKLDFDKIKDFEDLYFN